MSGKISFWILFFAIYHTSQTSGHSDGLVYIIGAFYKCSYSDVGFVNVLEVFWTSIKCKGYIFVEMKLNSCIPIYFLVVISMLLIFCIIAYCCRNAYNTRRYVAGSYTQSAIRIAITSINSNNIIVNIPTFSRTCLRKPISHLLCKIRTVSF